MKEFWASLSTWKKIKLIISAILVIFTAIFAFYNWQQVEVDFLFFQIRISLTLLIFICLVAGYLCSSLFDYRKHKVKQVEINRLKQELKDLKSRS
ncbi:MAG: DUF1049 domain-containing protein [Bacteroidetes bacterium]|nr:MAG: DUF1049 domain-containing protein [Bacteroidota bacterium]